MHSIAIYGQYIFSLQKSFCHPIKKNINYHCNINFRTFKVSNYFSLKDVTSFILRAIVVYCFKGSCDKTQSYNIVNVCTETVGVEQKSIYNIFSHRVEIKKKVMSDRNHVLSMYYELLPSGHGYWCLKVKPCPLKSFIPYSIRLLNSTS